MVLAASAIYLLVIPAQAGIQLLLCVFREVRSFRSAAGEWKPCTWNNKASAKVKMDSRFRGNDVQRKELDSGFCRNDEH